MIDAHVWMSRTAHTQDEWLRQERPDTLPEVALREAVRHRDKLIITE